MRYSIVRKNRTIGGKEVKMDENKMHLIMKQSEQFEKRKKKSIL